MKHASPVKEKVVVFAFVVLKKEITASKPKSSLRFRLCPTGSPLREEAQNLQVRLRSRAVKRTLLSEDSILTHSKNEKEYPHRGTLFV